MVNNNELLLGEEQQKKKKLYKNWKLYAIALGIIVIGAGTGLGIYYGINTNHSEVTKIALNTLNTSAITGIENMLEQDAFDAFIGNNQEKYSDLETNVEISSFTAPSYASNGELIVKAKTNSTKYSGKITITIKTIKQTALDTLNLKATIAVDENATEEETFQVFLDKNKNILNDNLILDQVELSNFEAPKITTNGKLTITVKEGSNSKYTGSIEIETKYTLSNSNLSKVIRYLSDNNLLNFNIPTGTLLGEDNVNLLLVLINVFRQFMNGNYEYANNIRGFTLKTYNWGPSQTQLNTKGYVWSPPKYSTLPDGTKVSSLFIIVTVYYTDGTSEDIKITNLNATITMV